MFNNFICRFTFELPCWLPCSVFFSFGGRAQKQEHIDFAALFTRVFVDSASDGRQKLERFRLEAVFA